jgi:hypothetical protein
MSKSISAKIRKSRTDRKGVTQPLDSPLTKRGRGRPRGVPAGQVSRRAAYMQRCFDQVWNRLGPRLSTAQTEADVATAFDEEATPHVATAGVSPALYPLVLKIVHGRNFPKARNAQVKFLAASLAGWGVISPRRSRDLCEQERAQHTRAHHILRYEFYVACSCGYEGPSRNHACPTCGAIIDFGGNGTLS